MPSCCRVENSSGFWDIWLWGSESVWAAGVLSIGNIEEGFDSRGGDQAVVDEVFGRVVDEGFGGCECEQGCGEEGCE